jgi:hypothetical protein
MAVGIVGALMPWHVLSVALVSTAVALIVVAFVVMIAGLARGHWTAKASRRCRTPNRQERPAHLDSMPFVDRQR